MSIRAKFRCVQKDQTEGGYTVKFEPVTNGSPENKQFFGWTPWGSLEIGTVNGKAGQSLDVGKEYYLDLTPAD